MAEAVGYHRRAPRSFTEEHEHEVTQPIDVGRAGRFAEVAG
ncbi:MAG: hypothetical protein R3A52_05705 [Polyangiales bacterium]